MRIGPRKAQAFGVPCRQNLFVKTFIEPLENRRTTLSIGNLCPEMSCDVGGKILAAEKRD
jgi:predicted RNase H-like nuclease